MISFNILVAARAYKDMESTDNLGGVESALGRITSASTHEFGLGIPFIDAQVRWIPIPHMSGAAAPLSIEAKVLLDDKGRRSLSRGQFDRLFAELVAFLENLYIPAWERKASILLMSLGPAPHSRFAQVETREEPHHD